MRILAITVMLAAWLCSTVAGQAKPSRLIEYKVIGDAKLALHYFAPRVLESDANADSETSPRKHAAVVFFFGGGWVGGRPAQFYPQCERLAAEGVACFSAEYRVKNRNQSTPFDCVRDGKSAVRWIREHAAEFQIDPDRIIAAGGSAGGHVAACTATIADFDEEQSDISSMPNALVLFNPVIDTSPRGFGFKTLGKRYREISPLEHVRKELPPTLILQGDADTTTPPSGHREFQRRMLAAGNQCELKIYADQKHGFFNPGRPGGGYEATTNAMLQFLRKFGYLDTATSPRQVHKTNEN